jgi:hypothetical protein
MSGIGPGVGVAEAGAIICCADAYGIPAAASTAATPTLRMRTLAIVMTFPPALSLFPRARRIGLDLLRCLTGDDSSDHVSGVPRGSRQVGTIPTRPVNGLATANFPSTILSGSAAKERVAGPSITAAASRGL